MRFGDGLWYFTPPHRLASLAPVPSISEICYSKFPKSLESIMKTPHLTNQLFHSKQKLLCERPKKPASIQSPAPRKRLGCSGPDRPREIGHNTCDGESDVLKRCPSRVATRIVSTEFRWMLCYLLAVAFWGVGLCRVTRLLWFQGAFHGFVEWLWVAHSVFVNHSCLLLHRYWVMLSYESSH